MKRKTRRTGDIACGRELPPSFAVANATSLGEGGYEVRERAQIERYRKTLVALRKLKRRKAEGGATDRELRLIDTEIEEVTETLCHLLKGESRYRWHW